MAAPPPNKAVSIFRSRLRYSVVGTAPGVPPSRDRDLLAEDEEGCAVCALGRLALDGAGAAALEPAAVPGGEDGRVVLFVFVAFCVLWCVAKAALEIDRAANRAKFCPADLQAAGNGCLRKSSPRSSPVCVCVCVCAHVEGTPVSGRVNVSQKVEDGWMDQSDKEKEVPGV